MPLTPTNDYVWDMDATPADAPAPLPSKTYRFNMNTGQFDGGMIDGADALRQAITKALATSRFRYLVYGHEYGCELRDLIGQDVTNDFLDMEIPRMAKDALEWDDRIDAVEDVNVTRTGDAVFISLRIEAAEGFSLEMEVPL